MAAWRDDAAGKSFVYVAQRGKITNVLPESLTPAQRQKIAKKGNRRFEESDTEFADKVSVHDGDDGPGARGAARGRIRGVWRCATATLYALHAEGAAFAVSSVPLASGVPHGAWQRVFAVPASIKPADLGDRQPWTASI